MAELEKDIERKICRWAKANGWLVYKLTSPARRSVPDRMFMRAGKVVFIEMKRPGGKCTSGQDREISRLLAVGMPTFVCDNVEHGKEILTSFMGETWLS